MRDLPDEFTVFFTLLGYYDGHPHIAGDLHGGSQFGSFAPGILDEWLQARLCQQRTPRSLASRISQPQNYPVYATWASGRSAMLTRNFYQLRLHYWQRCSFVREVKERRTRRTGSATLQTSPSAIGTKKRARILPGPHKGSC